MNEEKKKYCRIDKWHKAGYTGKGVKIAVFENFKGHGANVADILKQVAPDAEILERPKPGLTTINGHLTPESQGKIRQFYWSLVGESVNIVEMSLGGNDTPEIEQAQRGVLLANNVTLITSAGNEGERGLSDAATLDTWISVGACTLINGKPKRTHYSSIGEKLDVCGFSGLYLSAGRYVHGTSFSAPWVAGMLALWFQWHKEKYGRYPTPEESLGFLKENAKDLLEPGHDPKTGYGLFVLPEISSLEGTKSMTTKLKDLDKVAPWARQSVAKAIKKEIMKGDGENWDPKGIVTREQLAVILDRLDLLE